jgi:hypothetical protein
MADVVERPPAAERLARIAFTDKPEGPIAAAIIAGGIGAAALGVFTTLAEASTGLKDWLAWSDRVGPLSGKTILAVVVWLVSWVILHAALQGRPYETRRALVVALVLIALGVLGTFPTFFQLFGDEAGTRARLIGSSGGRAGWERVPPCEPGWTPGLTPCPTLVSPTVAVTRGRGLLVTAFARSFPPVDEGTTRLTPPDRASPLAVSGRRQILKECHPC